MYFFLLRNICIYYRRTLFLLKGRVREKLKRIKAYVEKYSMVIASNLTSIWCVYRKLLKTTHCDFMQKSMRIRAVKSKPKALRHFKVNPVLKIQNELQSSTRIVKKTI